MAGFIIGVDEVGRGPWAGPLVAAAVILHVDSRIDGVADSKKLTPKRRLVAAGRIRRVAHGIGIGWVSAAEIDTHGLTWANRQAMLRALSNLPASDAEIIIDGNFNYVEPQYPRSRALIGADATLLCVAAASVIAKTARDSFMARMSLVYPEYGFAKHVGYGTSAHKAALTKSGPTPLHRMSFKPLLSQTKLSVEI